jgi:hypothetical protein
LVFAGLVGNRPALESVEPSPRGVHAPLETIRSSTLPCARNRGVRT